MLTFAKKAFCVLTLLSLFVGCKEDGCGERFEQSIALTAANNASTLILSMEGNKKPDLKPDPLAFLIDPTVVREEADLEVTLKGKYATNVQIQLSVNGLKVTHKDGSSFSEAMVYNSKKNNSVTTLRMHKLYVNGAESFLSFVTKLKKNKGALVVKLWPVVNGANVKSNPFEIVGGTMTFRGKSIKKCPTTTPTPTSTPTPVPESPVTTLTSVDPSASLTASTTISFQFSSSVIGSTFWCSLDQAMATPCASPQIYSNLANGSHGFQVYAQSPQGPTEKQPVTYSWSVDAVPPSVTIDNAASLATTTNSDSISFSFTANKTGSTFKCALDGGAASPCASPRGYQALAEGVHIFKVTAVDALGNVSTAPAVFQWTIDKTAPVTSFVDVTPSQAVSNSDAKTFTFLANESAQFECSLDAAAFATCTSPASLTALGEGDHRYDVRAIDAAGNQGLAVSYAWTVDLTAPQVQIGVTAPAEGLTNSKSVSVGFTSNEDGTTYCSVDQAPSVVCTSPFVASGLSEGDHGLDITAVDLAGNISAVAHLAWQMDFTAPMISLGAILPSASSVINAQEISIAVNVPAGAVLQASVDGTAMMNASNPVALSNLVEGSHQISLQAIDKAGNISEIISHSFVVDVTAPVISLQAELTAPLLNVDHNSFAVTSSEDARFECSLDGAGFDACESPVQVSGLADGAHSMMVRAIDSAGNVSIVSEYRWSVDTIAPTTTVAASISGHDATFTLGANETPVTFLCSLDGADLQACATPQSYPGLAAGTHSFVAKAVDAAGNVDAAGASYQFIVVDPITTTLQSSVPGESVTNVTSMTFTFSASQANASFLCSIDGAAAVACQSPYNYTGIKDGAHSFKVRAVDVYGNVDSVGATHVWTVDTLAPVVSGYVTSTSTNSITLTWTTDEPATTQVRYGLGFTVNQSTAEDMNLSTSHSVKLTGLTSNSTYTVQIFSRDALGNAYLSGTKTVKTTR
jgi:hypothetical protein